MVSLMVQQNPKKSNGLNFRFFDQYVNGSGWLLERYLKCDGLGEVGVLDEAVCLTTERCGGGTVKKS